MATQHEFRIQTIVCHDGNACAFEVLNKNPALFASADEGFILEADLQAMSFAIELSKCWPGNIHFNMEATSLLNVGDLTHDSSHARVVVEIVERGLDTLSDANIKKLIKKLVAFKEAGFQLAMDDATWTQREQLIFKSVEPNYIKTVDWLSLADVSVQSGKTVIIAEMIENQTLADVARTLGADLLQGYHYETPAFAESLAEAINDRRRKNAIAA